MSINNPRTRRNGSWRHRVKMAPGRSFAYRPGQVLVRAGDIDRAETLLAELAEQGGANRPTLARRDTRHEDDLIRMTAFGRFDGVADPLEAVAVLRDAGLDAQVNHVMFAHADEGLSANPFYANPFYANPFYANPFYANPFYANPFYANPFYANPFYANPFYANPNPAADPLMRESGNRASLARPGKEPKTEPFSEKKGATVAILDTGYAAAAFAPPSALSGASIQAVDLPDAGLHTGYLDPVAGHGTFIAGIISQLTPGTNIEVYDLVEPHGDVDEDETAEMLQDLAARSDPPDLVNMSFGGYSPDGMGYLADTVAALHKKGTAIVASAGNDGSPLPMYPGVLPEVVAVGALDHEQRPASFTNYGPWVRACSLGVEVVSTFFSGFDGAHPTHAGGDDIDSFAGWAIWSGTSFAAPRVVAALAAHMVDRSVAAHVAVQQLIDGPGQRRNPYLGTLVPQPSP